MLRAIFHRVLAGTLMYAVLSVAAFAQYGGGSMGGASSAGTYTPPKGGYSSATGIGIGLGAAAGAGLAFWALHNRAGTVVGCVEPGNRLINEKDKNTYALLASNSVVLAPGERVALKGKKRRDESGNLTFDVQKLAKDYGPCKQ